MKPKERSRLYIGGFVTGLAYFVLSQAAGVFQPATAEHYGLLATISGVYGLLAVSLFTLFVRLDRKVQWLQPKGAKTDLIEFATDFGGWALMMFSPLAFTLAVAYAGPSIFAATGVAPMTTHGGWIYTDCGAAYTNWLVTAICSLSVSFVLAGSAIIADDRNAQDRQLAGDSSWG